MGPSHFQPHNNGKNEIHWNESNCADQGYKVTEEGDQGRKEGHEDIVDQGDAESHCQVSFAEPRLICVAELHLKELVSWAAIDLQHANRFRCPVPSVMHMMGWMMMRPLSFSTVFQL